MTMLWLLACASAGTTPVIAERPACLDPTACTAACDAGDALACNLLGLWRHDGLEGTVADSAAAGTLYRRACDLGAGIGCYNYASVLLHGDGVTRDVAEAERFGAEAARLDRASCAAGGLAWCTHLAGLLVRGDGVPADPAPGRALNAVRRNDPQEAEVLLVRACDAPIDLDPVACALLAQRLEGRGDGAGAVARYERACSKGLAPACVAAVRVAATGGGVLTPERAKELLRIGCARGDASACSLAGETSSP